LLEDLDKVLTKYIAVNNLFLLASGHDPSHKFPLTPVHTVCALGSGSRDRAGC